LVVAALAAPLAAIALFAVEPTDQSWFPRCALFKLTGLHCPFCGATRCGHALLNGDLGQALAWNPLAVLVLPLGTLWLYWAAWRILQRRPLPAVRVKTWLMRTCVIGIVVFWVLRNLPFYPFDLLAPHKLIVLLPVSLGRTWTSSIAPLSRLPTTSPSTRHSC
jgi:hypothetical protein